MTDIAVIILTKDEKLHIKRCLERLAPLGPRQIFIVDCFSADGTQEIVKQYSAEIGSCATDEKSWLMPLAEAIGTVVHRQAAAGSNPSTVESIAYSDAHCNGGRSGGPPIFSWAIEPLRSPARF